MSKEQSCERSPSMQPLFGKSFESDVMGKHHAAKFISPLQNSIIRERISTVFNRGQYISVIPKD